MQPNDLIVLHVTAHDLDVAIKSMMKQPYEVVAPVIDKFVNQANGGASAPGTPAPPVGPLGAPDAGSSVVPGLTALPA